MKDQLQKAFRKGRVENTNKNLTNLGVKSRSSKVILDPEEQGQLKKASDILSEEIMTTNYKEQKTKG